eukprot:m.71068 g.71068  ORF g.71068 m.71068 type:complete len:312 (+) comp14130_c2_seq2:136-1071(+)
MGKKGLRRCPSVEGGSGNRSVRRQREQDKRRRGGGGGTLAAAVDGPPVLRFLWEAAHLYAGADPQLSRYLGCAFADRARAEDVTLAPSVADAICGVCGQLLRAPLQGQGQGQQQGQQRQQQQGQQGKQGQQQQQEQQQQQQQADWGIAQLGATVRVGRWVSETRMSKRGGARGQRRLSARQRGGAPRVVLRCNACEAVHVYPGPERFPRTPAPSTAATPQVRSAVASPAVVIRSSMSATASPASRASEAANASTSSSNSANSANKSRSQKQKLKRASGDLKALVAHQQKAQAQARSSKAAEFSLEDFLSTM